MQIEEYFDFLAENEIRIKGHRIGIEDVLYEYIHNAMTPDELASRFPSLALEEIYATLLYYVRNQSTMDAYLKEWLDHGQAMWLNQQQNPTPDMLRLRKIRAERQLRQAQLPLEQQEERVLV